MTATQRAVWRNGGSNSAENDVRTRTEVARRTFSESRRCAKPPSVVSNRRTPLKKQFGHESSKTATATRWKTT